MTRFAFAIIIGAVCATATAAIDEKAMGEARSLRDRGEFEKATRVLQGAIDQSSGTLTDAETRTIKFEIERVRRIRQDYTLTREKLVEKLTQQVPDFKPSELDDHEREGHLDTLVVDGQKFYFNSSAANLIKRVPELRARRKKGGDDDVYRKLYANMVRVKEARKISPDQLVLPQDFVVKYSLTVNADAAPAGKTVRCWLPAPHAFPFQTDFYVLKTDPTECLLAQPEAPHRTIYLERKAEKGKPTEFKAEFVYRCWARQFDPDPAKVLPYDKDNPVYQFYTASRPPHLDTSNELLKQLNAEIVGQEKNPIVAARKIYDWMQEHMIYQYAREYSTLENISHYTASRRAGDCGQHGMFFIAMCRLNGIPARWQSGWECFEAKTNNNMHDWSEIYVEPYGWIPVDADMGLNVARDAEEDLGTTRTRELAAWLFGNMDNCRLATNSDYGMALDPPKEDFRSETVDFQRGEVECDGANLYFDQWEYSMKFQPISSDEAAKFAAKFVPPPVEYPARPEAPKAAKSDAATTAAAKADTPTSTPK